LQRKVFTVSVVVFTFTPREFPRDAPDEMERRKAGNTASRWIICRKIFPDFSGDEYRLKARA